MFAALLVIVGAVMGLCWLLLPEGHRADPGISLKPGPILAEYASISRHPCFATYAFAGAFSFAGLFAYVAGSPIVFMDNFHLGAGAYSGIFGLLSVGLIGMSQINILLLKRFSSAALFGAVLAVQVAATAIFAVGTWAGWYGLEATIVLFFIALSCIGVTYPNAASIALMPFGRNAGSAAALLGFTQLGIGAVISSGISLGKTSGNLPVIAIMAVTSLLGGLVLLAGRRRAGLALDQAPAQNL